LEEEAFEKTQTKKHAAAVPSFSVHLPVLKTSTARIKLVRIRHFFDPLRPAGPVEKNSFRVQTPHRVRFEVAYLSGRTRDHVFSNVIYDGEHAHFVGDDLDEQKFALREYYVIREVF
jgi:hypothetical protein|tara:strand:+ start:38 stop:388 length:351 start_codon:yes stop_codon:yes gene_type:complete